MAKVLVSYKSGRKVVIKCSSFKVRASGSRIVEVVWSKDAKPRPIHLGVDEIESVWEL